MHKSSRRWSLSIVLASALAASGCVLAAAGAGAGGAIYVTERGAESVVPAPVAKTLEASRGAIQAFGFSETKTSSEQDGAIEKRSLEGKTSDREVEIDLRTEGSGTHVDVVVKKTAVTWDKDLAKQILSKIVDGVK